jgi:hypothetical protein
LNEAYHHEGKDANEPHKAAIWILVRMNCDQRLSANLQNVRPWVKETDEKKCVTCVCKKAVSKYATEKS